MPVASEFLPVIETGKLGAKSMAVRKVTTIYWERHDMTRGDAVSYSAVNCPAHRATDQRLQEIPGVRYDAHVDALDITRSAQIDLDY